MPGTDSRMLEMAPLLSSVGTAISMSPNALADYASPNGDDRVREGGL